MKCPDSIFHLAKSTREPLTLAALDSTVRDAQCDSDIINSLVRDKDPMVFTADLGPESFDWITGT